MSVREIQQDENEGVTTALLGEYYLGQGAAIMLADGRILPGVRGWH